MTSTQEKTSVLDAMGIPQWVRRESTAVQPVSLAPEPECELPKSEGVQVNNAIGIKLSGNAASGWLWLTEAPVSGRETLLLTDIQKAVNCRDGGLLAQLDSSATATLSSVIEAELITRLVIFGSREFQAMLGAELGQSSLAKVETLGLTELEKSATAKRQLWNDLQKLLNS